MVNGKKDGGSTRNYRVSHLMKRYGVSRGTVKNWEEAGVLPPATYPLTPDGKRYGRSKWWPAEAIEARDEVFEKASLKRREE